MNYKFEIDKWYIVNKTVAGKLDAGLELGTVGEVEWFETEDEWLTKCNELGIEIETNEL